MVAAGRTSRNPVARAEIADGEAEIAAYSDEREAGTGRRRLGAAVGKTTPEVGEAQSLIRFLLMPCLGLLGGDLQLLGAKPRGQHEAADPQVVGGPVTSVEVEDEAAAERDVDRRADPALVRGRAIGAERVDMEVL